MSGRAPMAAMEAEIELSKKLVALAGSAVALAKGFFMAISSLK